MTNDLHTFCNGSAWNQPRLLELRLIINIMGFGTSVIGKLVKSNIKRNLFFQIKDRVIEEQIIGGATHRRMQQVKVYGLDSSKSMRNELMDLVTNRVQFHKDKVIEPRIHEQLSALRYNPKKDRIDHPDNGHDDMVIAWALALYVLYRGGDIANEFGITRYAIRTDAEIDEEVYDVKQDAEVISDKLEIVGNEEVKQQLETLKPATQYAEWVENEIRVDQEALMHILSTKQGKQAYIEKYHLDPNDFPDQGMTRIPDSAFTTDYYESTKDQGIGRGNLYAAFIGVASR